MGFIGKGENQLNTCKICSVQLARPWPSGICCHCDWHLDEGYTENEIKEMFKKVNETNDKDVAKLFGDTE